LGASTYADWHGDESALGTKWFVDRYAAFNLTFDHIYAFEFVKRDPGVVFRDIPLHVLSRYSYMNVGVEDSIDSRFNVWNIVRNVAQASDHVTVKIDIDSPDIEESLIEQFKRSSELLSLVDEVFYEDHVDTSVMYPFWGRNIKRKLSDSYGDFLYLRQRGIRMHSWP
jgi:hypothetical protein